MRWKLIGRPTNRRGATPYRESSSHGSKIELVTFRHDSEIPFRCLQEAAAVHFLERVVLTNDMDRSR